MITGERAEFGNSNPGKSSKPVISTTLLVVPRTDGES